MVSAEQARLAELRREQAALKEKGEQVGVLAALALKLLEDRCPVCGQTYDKDATRIRLLALVKTGGSQAAPGPDNLTELLAALAAREKDAAAADLSLRSAEQAAAERSKSEESLAKRLSELGVVADGHAGRDAALAKAIDDADALTKRAAELQRAGELLALGLAQSSAVATIDELRREAETLRRDNAAREKVISARNETGERAQAVIEALREAASAVVGERLREIGPLLQRKGSMRGLTPTRRFVSLASCPESFGAKASSLRW